MTITDDDIRNQAQWAAGPKAPYHESKVSRAEFVSGFVEGARWVRLQSARAMALAEDRQANAERAAEATLRPARTWHRPARELLDVARDCYTEGFIAGLEATVATEYSDDASSALEAWQRSEVKRTLEEPGAEYIWLLGADGELHRHLDAAEEKLAELREAVRELLANDGGDGRFDGSRFAAARETCRELTSANPTAHPHAPAGGAAESDR